jgi:hypothetical protein
MRRSPQITPLKTTTESRAAGLCLVVEQRLRSLAPRLSLSREVRFPTTRLSAARIVFIGEETRTIIPPAEEALSCTPLRLNNGTLSRDCRAAGLDDASHAVCCHHRHRSNRAATVH